ncbi:MAG: class I SAM-dependent methyltransferase [Xanthobacteraceae bacterium]
MTLQSKGQSELMPSPFIAGYAARANEYVEARPEYPAIILSELPLADTIVELGAGTGKFTQLLASTGNRILAVEPVREMAVRIPIGRFPNVSVVIGSAESIPAPDGCAGLVCCATAFHWFDYERATGEILRILNEAGALALIWNVRDDRVSWVAAFSRLLDDYAGDAPRQSSSAWRTIFSDTRFVLMTIGCYPFSQPMPTKGLVNRALSNSFIALLSQDEQEIIRAKVMNIVNRDPQLAGKDSIDFPYVTELYVFRRCT